MLDRGRLARAAQVAEQHRRGDHDEAEPEHPDLVLGPDVGLEAERDGDEHHATEDQKSSIALAFDGGHDAHGRRLAMTWRDLHRLSESRPEDYVPARP